MTKFIKIISPALACGYYAAKAMVDAIDKNDLSREGLWSYNSAVMSHYGRTNAISYVTLQFLRAIEAEGMDYILRRKVLTEDEVKAVFDGGDPDTGLFSIMKKIFRCFPKLGLLKDMKTLVKAVKSMSRLYENYPAVASSLPEWVMERNRQLGEDL